MTTDPHLAGVPLGPAMMRLNPKQRLFAFLYGSGICASASEAARQAGYHKPYQESAWQLKQREDVTAAVAEAAKLYLGVLPDGRGYGGADHRHGGALRRVYQAMQTAD